MTGTLTIRYRRPTPLLAPLDLAARHTGKEGRKVFAWGGIYHQGELTAEADGVFIEVPPDRMLEHRVGQRPQHRGAAVVDPDWQRMMARGGGRRVRRPLEDGSARVGPVGSASGGGGGTKLKRT